MAKPSRAARKAAKLAQTERANEPRLPGSIPAPVVELESNMAVVPADAPSQDINLFGLIFQAILAVLIPLLQANGLAVNWKGSLAIYVILAGALMWTTPRHLIPHKSRWVKVTCTVGILILLVSIEVPAVLKQYKTDNAPMLAGREPEPPPQVPASQAKDTSRLEDHAKHIPKPKSPSFPAQKLRRYPGRLDTSKNARLFGAIRLMSPFSTGDKRPFPFVNITFRNHGGVEVNNWWTAYTWAITAQRLTEKDEATHFESTLIAAYQVKSALTQPSQLFPGEEKFVSLNDPQLLRRLVDDFENIKQRKRLLYIFSTALYVDPHMAPGEIGVTEQCVVFSGSIDVMHECGRNRSFIDVMRQPH